MIYGIGTDIVEYARDAALWERYGGRFAAKEAFAKAVGSGMRHPVALRRIGVAHDGLGKPVLQFDETLRTWLAQLVWCAILFGTYANSQCCIVGRVSTRHVGLKPDLQGFAISAANYGALH